MRERKKAERDSLVLSEQTFPIIEQITAGMPGGFFIYHADGDKRLIYANRALIRIYGCADLSDFQAYTGYTFPGLVYPEDLEMTERSIQQQLLTGGHGYHPRGSGAPRGRTVPGGGSAEAEQGGGLG